MAYTPRGTHTGQSPDKSGVGSKDLLDLLNACESEIQNLMKKCDAKETQGWEGLQRRTVLLSKIGDAKVNLQIKLMEGIHGDVI